MENIVLREFEECEWLAMKNFYKKVYGSNYIFTNRVFFNWNFFSCLYYTSSSGIVEANILLSHMIIGNYPIIRGLPLQIDIF